MTPTQTYENILRAQGYQYIAGVDEVGRGALAGPIVAAAVIMPRSPRIRGVQDSKKLSHEQRVFLYRKIIQSAISWSVSMQSAHSIDERGISWANKEVIRESLLSLHIQPDYVLADYFVPDVDIASHAFTKGDAKIYTIAAASIVAKVTRDMMMRVMHQHFPEYQFHRNKGYGSEEHMDAIGQYGISRIHRRSFCNNVAIV